MHRYAVAQSAPLVDMYQNLMDYSAEQMEVNGAIYTTITFTRPTISDDERDLSLDNDGIYLLFAIGIERNFNESDQRSIQQHSTRGIVTGQFNFFRCGGMMITDKCKHKVTPRLAQPSHSCVFLCERADHFVLLIISIRYILADLLAMNSKPIRNV